AFMEGPQSSGSASSPGLRSVHYTEENSNAPLTPAGAPFYSRISMLFPLFLKLAGRDVLVVGGGPVGTAKARALVEAGARVTVVAPEVSADVRALAEGGTIVLAQRAFAEADVDGAWVVVAAATPEGNRAVAAAAQAPRT